MRELSRRGVKAFAVLSFMAFTSCANEGQNRQLPPGREDANAHAVGDAEAPTGSLRRYAA